jgi:hypothetical protein
VPKPCPAAPYLLFATNMRLTFSDAERGGAIPRTEDSAERGLVDYEDGAHDPVTYKDLGEAEELDQDEVGDIADEGAGHRG